MSSGLERFKQTGLLYALRSCQLFIGLPAADLESIASLTVIKRLARGEYLFHEGEPSRGFYVVMHGGILVHRVSAAGKEQAIHLFRPWESFAEGALATQQGYPADARAVESSQVALIQKAGFLDLLRRQPELALRMLASMSSHLRVLVNQIEDLTFKDVETRVINWLLERCPSLGDAKPATFNLATTKRMLAMELGTVSETLSRTFAKLRAQKLVLVKGKTITILSPVGLAAAGRRNMEFHPAGGTGSTGDGQARRGRA
jgi:CRP/FNR family transcriptional regulator